MGCDIHCYVEYREPNATSWTPFGERINPGRNYEVFGNLAGVRDGMAQVPPRGIPSDMAWQSLNDWWIFISDADHGDDEGCCSREQAEQYHCRGSAYRGETSAGLPQWVQHPDWHTPSWVTPDEWERAINADCVSVQYRALLAAMRVLAERNEVRVVFWFDN